MKHEQGLPALCRPEETHRTPIDAPGGRCVYATACIQRAAGPRRVDSAAIPTRASQVDFCASVARDLPCLGRSALWG
eukprot:2212549-Pyramimonas_sp.AAC.1